MIGTSGIKYYLPATPTMNEKYVTGYFTTSAMADYGCTGMPALRTWSNSTR